MDLKVHPEKNRLTVGEYSSTDFLRVTYFKGRALGLRYRLITSLCCDKPWK